MKKYVVCIIIKTSLEGRQRITNTIMYITITRMQRHITKTETSNIRHMAYNKFPMKSKSILIKCLHQAAFSPQKTNTSTGNQKIYFLHGPASQPVQSKNVSQTQT